MNHKCFKPFTKVRQCQLLGTFSFRPVPGLCPWTSLGHFHLQDPLYYTPASKTRLQPWLSSPRQPNGCRNRDQFRQ